MAIVALKKLTFCGLSAEKPQVLAQLQKLDGAHLIELKKFLNAALQNRQTMPTKR